MGDQLTPLKRVPHLLMPPMEGIQPASTQRNSEFRFLPDIPLFVFLVVVVVLIEPGSLYTLGEPALTLLAH